MRPPVPGSDPSTAPLLEEAGAAALLADRWQLRGELQRLPSYQDLNYRVRSADGTWVLKVANAAEDRAQLELQQRALTALARELPGGAPAPRAADGEDIVEVQGEGGAVHLARLLSFLPGDTLARAGHAGPTTWRSLGRLLARVDRTLAEVLPAEAAGTEAALHEAADRPFHWDLAQAEWTHAASAEIQDPARRRLLERALLQFRGQATRMLGRLPRALIHHDANDHNLLVDDRGEVTGLIDFGDMIRTARVFELAVAGAYLAMEQVDPVAVLSELAGAYHETEALSGDEISVLLPATAMRLAVSVLMSTRRARLDPGNDYILVSQAPAWRLLEELDGVSPAAAEDRVREACGLNPRHEAGLDPAEVLDRRRRHTGPSLSLSYRQPLAVVRGRGCWLFDKSGRAYLDGVNNVCHVGHCHPRVVAAAQEQIARLNTNTRYLHDHLARYGERLAAMFPDPLEVVYLVNSGSEANELALRLARAATGRRGVVAVEHGYHGNTGALIDLSSYKHAGPGGRGAPDWVATVPCPDPYRGRYRSGEGGGEGGGEPGGGGGATAVAASYAAHVDEAAAALAGRGLPPAAFLAEPLIGCGGQIVPPAGWLVDCFARARAAGALCIADEVQIGFGRVGSHWWGFEAQGALPDIVTLGKPIGNGHPMAAVVTTRAIAEAFDPGMEYFNTFGGNPVSCAIGLAVLDVLEEEGLRDQAAATGQLLLDGFRELAERHPVLGDVRGQGLYLGVEFVRDRDRREPAPEELAALLEAARADGLLLSADGPDHNVLKLKPPLVFGEAEARLLLAVVERQLTTACDGTPAS